jgi:inosine/xanthosine triphosphate pyrophosphatase family protein
MAAAELAPELKHRVSHRGLALASLRAMLPARLAPDSAWTVRYGAA